MAFASNFGMNNLQTAGTSCYNSNMHYLGYSPYPMSEDVKPNLFWVSASTNHRHCSYLQAKYEGNLLLLFQTVRHCLEQELKIVQEVLILTRQDILFCHYEAEYEEDLSSRVFHLPLLSLSF